MMAKMRMRQLMTDQAIRQDVLSVEQSFCVTAPAGSGKTSLLTQRILALLSRVERPEQILAITFTRKAAAEMRSRVLATLEQASRGITATSEHEALSLELAQGALKHAETMGWSLNAEKLNIRTIDGLSAQLNRSMPVTSGLGGGALIADDASRLYAEAVDDLYGLMPENSQRGEALRELLLLMENNWQRCSELLISLLAQRGDWLSALGQHENPEAAAELALETLERIVSDRLAQAQDQLPQGWVYDVLEAANQAKHRLQSSIADGSVEEAKANTFEGDSLQLSSELSSLDHWKWFVNFVLVKEGTPRKSFNKNWGFRAKLDTEIKQQLIDRIAEIGDHPERVDILKEIAALPTLSLASEEWEGVLRLSRVLPVLAAQLLAVFQSRGMVDHTHMAMAADLALGDDSEPTDLALRLDYQIQHILVDEFQDTSLTQFQLLEKLCRGWSEYNFVNPKSPRTLFIVGDAMQSIYGFRYADVGLFLKAQSEGIAGVALKSRALTRNFRTQANVIAWVNQQFEALIPANGDSRLGVVPLTKAEAVNPAVEGQSVAIHVFPDDVHREATFLAEKIVQIQVNQPGSTIAVLGRSRAAITPTSLALAQAGIDVVGSDLTPYNQRSAVADLMSLVRWLANPADTIAMLALFRAPMVGVTFKDIGFIAPLLSEQSVSNLAELIKSGRTSVSADGCARLRHACAALAWAESKRDRLDLTAWIQQTWARVGGNTAYPTSEVLDTEALFDQIRQQEVSTNRLDISALNDWFDKGYSKAESATASVELMTLHKSKGLEFDHVFIVGAARAGRSGDSPLLRWYRDGNKGLMIAAKPQSERQGSVYDYLAYLNKAQEQQELIRLFYVGVTRAKRSCTITATQKSEKAWPPTKTAAFWSRFCEAAGATVHYEPIKISAESDVSTAGEEVRTLRRVKSVDAPSGAISPTSTLSATNPVLAIGNLIQRRYGTALHRAVELLSKLDVVPESCPGEVLAAARFQLINAGMASNVLETQMVNIEQDLNNLLADERGRWLISSGHQDASSELSLWHRETQRELIIDRTFIDSITATRWVIDYKSSQPAEGEALDHFILRESEKYKEQLQTYCSLIDLYDGQKENDVVQTRAALYFPALTVFAEVAV